VDGRADLYGLGILLYHLTTGELPVPNGGPNEILRWHLNGPAADPSRVRPGTSPRLARFIGRLTMHDRDERPASAASALRLLGIRPAAGQRQSRVPVTARGSLASLRLALDAVRLGARRVFRLPRSPGIADALIGELTVWCQVRDLRIYRLTDPPERLVLHLLADRGGDGAALVRRYGLSRWLALEILGGVPLLDPEGATAGVAEAGSDRVGPAARAVAALIADCAAERPIVLCSGRAEHKSALARAVLRRMRSHASARPTAAARGGLLLVVEP
jgi:hypothetical protein